MPATRNDIDSWLDRLYDSDEFSHMIVKCDTFDYRGGAHDQCDYPVYVKQGDDPHKAERENGDQTMEVYSRNHSRAEQVAEFRAFHYD